MVRDSLPWSEQGVPSEDSVKAGRVSCAPAPNENPGGGYDSGAEGEPVGACYFKSRSASVFPALVISNSRSVVSRARYFGGTARVSARATLYLPGKTDVTYSPLALRYPTCGSPLAESTGAKTTVPLVSGRPATVTFPLTTARSPSGLRTSRWHPATSAVSAISPRTGRTERRMANSQRVRISAVAEVVRPRCRWPAPEVSRLRLLGIGRLSSGRTSHRPPRCTGRGGPGG